MGTRRRKNWAIDRAAARRYGQKFYDLYRRVKTDPWPQVYVESPRQAGGKDLMEQLMEHVPEPPKRTRRPGREAGVLKACLAWLAKHPDVLLVERRTNIAVDLGDRYVRAGVAGRADIWCVVDSLHYGQDTHVEIECKRTTGGKLSEVQEHFAAHCRESGIPYVVVHSLDGLKKFFDEELGLTDYVS